jgi:hypothetical protein
VLVESARQCWRDFKNASRAWASAPALPIVSAILVLPLETNSLVTPALRAAYPSLPWSFWALLVELPFLLFGADWLGTQRD